MFRSEPILVTGAAGMVGGVGGAVVEILRQRYLPVRALVRSHDERAEALSAMGGPVAYVDVPFDDWRDQELAAGLRPDDTRRRSDHITGMPALTVRSYVESRPDRFGSVRR